MERFDVRPYIDDRGSYKIFEFNHTLLALLFENLVGDKLVNKHVPEFMWRARKEIVSEFLNGYKCGSRRTLRRKYTSYSSKNYRLITEIIWLSRLKGYPSLIWQDGKYFSANIYLGKLSKKKPQANRIPLKPIKKLYKIVKPRNIPWKYMYILRDYRKTITKDKASEFINFILDNDSDRLDNEAKSIINNIKSIINSRIGVAEIKEISCEKSDDFVYDISIPENQLFIGGTIPIVLHNTGHGALGSIHAESPEAVISRLTSEPMNVPESLILTLDLIVLISRVKMKDRIYRKVINISEPYWDERSNRIRIKTIFEYDAYKDTYVFTGSSQTLDKISRRYGITLDVIIEDIRRRRTIIQWMIKKNIRDFESFIDIMKRYYLNPDEVYETAKLELLEMGVS